MAKNWTVIGRVMPERAWVDIPKMSLTAMFGSAKCVTEIEVQKGHARATLRTEIDFSLFQAIDAFRQSVSPFSNYISVQNRGAYFLIADVAIDLDTDTQHLCPVFEPIFDGTRPGYTFLPRDSEHLQVELYPLTVIEESVRNALHYLAEASRHSNYTFMYCRMAIEAVRAFYDPPTKRGISWSVVEGTGERAMCNALNIKRATIKSFQSKAATTRHGKSLISSSWEERRHAMEVAWEVVNRHILRLSGNFPSDSIEI
jgi:hypothetical protein